MKKEFALDPGGQKRLKITYEWNLANAEVSVDSQRIISFATKAEFQRGTTCKLPDGSILSVRFGPIEGAPFLKGVHVIRNGAPLPDSAAVPVPKWAWVFMAACAIIPIISLGGAVPAVIAAAGVQGTLWVARFKRWSVALRAALCTLIALGCWCALGLLIAAMRPTTTSANEWKVPFTKAMFMSSSPEKLMNEIDDAYSGHGYNEQARNHIRDTLRRNCDLLERKQCVAYLRTSLLEIQNRHTD